MQVIHIQIPKLKCPNNEVSIFKITIFKITIHDIGKIYIKYLTRNNLSKHLVDHFRQVEDDITQLYKQSGISSHLISE